MSHSRKLIVNCDLNASVIEAIKKLQESRITKLMALEEERGKLTSILESRKTKLMDLKNYLEFLLERKGDTESVFRAFLGERKQCWYVPNTGEGSSIFFRGLKSYPHNLDENGSIIEYDIGEKYLSSTLLPYRDRAISLSLRVMVDEAADQFDLTLPYGITVLMLCPSDEQVDALIAKAETGSLCSNPVVIVGYKNHEKLRTLEGKIGLLLNSHDLGSSISMGAIASSLEQYYTEPLRRAHIKVHEELWDILARLAEDEFNFNRIESRLNRLDEKISIIKEREASWDRTESGGRTISSQLAIVANLFQRAISKLSSSSDKAVSSVRPVVALPLDDLAVSSVRASVGSDAESSPLDCLKANLECLDRVLMRAKGRQEIAWYLLDTEIARATLIPQLGLRSAAQDTTKKFKIFDKYAPDGLFGLLERPEIELSVPSITSGVSASTSLEGSLIRSSENYEYGTTLLLVWPSEAELQHFALVSDKGHFINQYLLVIMEPDISESQQVILDRIEQNCLGISVLEEAVKEVVDPVLWAERYGKAAMEKLASRRSAIQESIAALTPSAVLHCGKDIYEGIELCQLDSGAIASPAR